MDHSRTEIITGTEGLDRLRKAEVSVFGAGGVGGFAAEALARAGVGTIRIFDFDTVSPSNINRQILALNSTVGKLKGETAALRIRDINPDCRVIPVNIKLSPDNISAIAEGTSWAVDAIDDLTAKICLITALREQKAVFISSMGAGNRTDPSKIRTGDISETSVCPLARRVRKALKEQGVFKDVPCVFSTEQPCPPRTGQTGRIIGSISYMPGIFGLTAAGWLIRRIAGLE